MPPFLQRLGAAFNGAALRVWAWFGLRAHDEPHGAATNGVAVLDPLPPPLPTPEPQAPVRRVVRHRKAEALAAAAPGTWYFREGILDRLDEYMDCMARVRRSDPDAYDLFSRVGLSVPPDILVGPKAGLDRSLRPGHRVTFGGVLFALRDTLDAKGYYHEVSGKRTIVPSFAYFQKFTRTRRVEPFDGEVYEVTVVYDRRRARRYAWPIKACLGVRPDGSLQLLREVVDVGSRFQTGTGDWIRTYQPELRWPGGVLSVAAEHNEDPESWVTGVFWSAYWTAAIAKSRVVVRASHAGLASAFGIEVARAKYFFKDRDVDVDVGGGRRRRIFHAVIAHDRVVPSGKVVRVKGHYRGLRHFDWNGYRVDIVLPDNNRWLEMSIGAHDDLPETTPHYTNAEIGTLISDRVNQ